MADPDIKDGKKRLPGPPVPPVRLPRGFVPFIGLFDQVVILFIVIAAIITSVPELTRV
jgi:hypothetical protein